MTSRYPLAQKARRRGSVMIEFTLLLPILVSLFLGVVFFGHDFYVYNQLEERTRAAARFASIQTYDTLNSLDPVLSCASCTVVLNPAQSQFASSVRNFMVYGTPSPAGTDQPLVEALGVGNIRVTMVVANSAPVGVRVGITGYSMLTPTGQTTLEDKPQAQFPYLGRYAAP